MQLSPLLLLTIILSLLPHPISSAGCPADIESRCYKLPHPGPCIYYFTHNPPAAPPKDQPGFYKLLVQLALDLTVRARKHLKNLPNVDPPQTAFEDCWRLYGNTIRQLNRTLHPKRQCTSLDAQTWLSASLTNLRTCQNGFSDLGESVAIIKPVIRYNISDIISNCLAINKAFMSPPVNATAAGGKRGKPIWWPGTGRKLLQLSANPNLVVAQDGSGKYRTIKEALDAAAIQISGGRFVIYVKAGVYNESLTIMTKLYNLTLIGDGIGKTIISGNRSVAQGYTTFSSSTFIILTDGFIASGITFRNTNGLGSQAVAMLSGSDRSVYYRCSFEGYQDTLCVFSQRQFFRECDIYGTIDFIFGNAAVVLQKCNIYARRPLPGESNVITAQGRTDPNQNTGIVIQSSRILAADDLRPVHRQVHTFLGRPWREYSRVLYLTSYISSILDPTGWMPYSGSYGLSTLYYAEYRNKGPGSATSKRVRWPGYHIVVQPSMVTQFTVANFIAGDSWIPPTTVPFAPGL